MQRRISYTTLLQRKIYSSNKALAQRFLKCGRVTTKSGIIVLNKSTFEQPQRGKKYKSSIKVLKQNFEKHCSSRRHRLLSRTTFSHNPPHARVFLQHNYRVQYATEIHVMRTLRAKQLQKCMRTCVQMNVKFALPAILFL